MLTMTKMDFIKHAITGLKSLQCVLVMAGESGRRGILKHNLQLSSVQISQLHMNSAAMALSFVPNFND